MTILLVLLYTSQFAFRDIKKTNKQKKKKKKKRKKTKQN